MHRLQIRLVLGNTEHVSRYHVVRTVQGNFYINYTFLLRNQKSTSSEHTPRAAASSFFDLVLRSTRGVLLVHLGRTMTSSFQACKMLRIAILVSTLVLIYSNHAVGDDGPSASLIWTDSHATFYGGNDGSGTMGGACGYGNMYNTGYGLETTALSSTLFNEGLSCGACFEIKCKVDDSRWCYPSAGSITITATNLCPANPDRPTDNGGWCNPPRTHFDLAYTMFSVLAQPVGGIIPVQFRRVTCIKQGGVRFTLNGNPWFNLVLIYNVAGDGNIVSAQMKGSDTAWFTMTQNWGQNWELKQKLQGQALSFQLTTGLGTTMVFANVADSNWSFSQTWEADTNFSGLAS